MAVDAFYTQVDATRYEAQEHTRGPWSAEHQHAGPPAALLGGAMQQAVNGRFIARLTFEILRPVPIAPLTVDVSVPRPGRRVALIEGTLSDDQGPVTLARGWAITTEEIPLPPDARAAGDAPLAPEDSEQKPFFDLPWDVGYHTAVELRFIHGAIRELGPAFAWIRSRLPLVDGRVTTPLEHILIGADSGNGLSAQLSPLEWLFINTSLSLHLHREPVDDWVGFDARSHLEPHGVGLATTTIVDREGPIGRGLQPLLVRPQD